MTEAAVRKPPASVVAAIVLSLVAAVAFIAFAVASTQVPAVRSGSPWGDNPYDTVVSFTEFLVPAVTVMIVLRMLAVPAVRWREVLRAAAWNTTLVGATVGADVLAVATGTNHDRWNGDTGPLVAVMLAIAGLAVATAVALRVARRATENVGPRTGDWMADLTVALAVVGPPGLARWVGRAEVHGFVRAHVTGIAALLSLTASLLVSTALAISEGGLKPSLFMLATAVYAAGLFGFCMISNVVLGLVAAPPDRSPPRARHAARVGMVAAAVAAPAALGLRQSIWLAVGQNGEIATTGQLAGIVGGAVLLVGVFATLVVLARGAAAGRGARRRRRSRPVMAFLAVAGLAIGYLLVVGVARAQPLGLPAPTGPYPVGRAMFDWTDASRVDPLTPQPGTPRELSVWLWYPSTARLDLPASPYAPGQWSALQYPTPWPGLFEGNLSVLQGHAHDSAPVAAGAFPVVVLEPGMGLSAPQFSTLAEDIASHGYLVAGVTPTYSANLTVIHNTTVTSTPAGNPEDLDRTKADALIHIWAADARFTADTVAALNHEGPFTGHVSSTPTTYLGHSFGGASALEACNQDPHCGGAIDLDGTQFGNVVHTGLSAPFLIIGSENSCVTGSCQPEDLTGSTHRDTARALIAASTGPRWCLSINGTAHFNFTDFAAYYLAPPISTLFPLGPIDGDHGLTLTADYLQAFLDHTTRGTTEPSLAGHPGDDPEAIAQPSCAP